MNCSPGKSFDENGCQRCTCLGIMDESQCGTSIFLEWQFPRLAIPKRKVCYYCFLDVPSYCSLINWSNDL